jgi:soluble lytic murein transglycosylase-like protein
VLGLVLWSVGPVEGPSVWAATDAVSVAADGPVVAQGRVAVELSPVFTPEVRYWETQILGWASGYGLDPNLVATVMQIESCGNPLVASPAGAQGLFQVMPFHFAAGEAMLDPDTNARRGLGYLLDSLESTGGHVGMALAGYNGGHVAAQGSWSTWPEETRRYYRWANGIYQDASSGMVDSPTLHDWLQAGGASLCQRAAAELAK